MRQNEAESSNQEWACPVTFGQRRRIAQWFDRLPTASEQIDRSPWTFSEVLTRQGMSGAQITDFGADLKIAGKVD
jgi:hypothetical protein